MNKQKFLEYSCPVPFLTLSTFATGEFRPCCWLDKPIMKSETEKFNLNVDAVEDIWMSEDAKRIRRLFLTDGATLPECSKTCFEFEQTGGISKRKAITQFMFPESVIDEILDNPDGFPKLIEVKITNLCNLKCKTCIPENSSSLMSSFVPQTAEDEKRIALVKQSYNEYLSGRGRVFFDSILRNIDDVQWIEFYGGEPFMIKDHKWFLKKIIDAGRAKDITLSYITNGTIFDEEFTAFFCQFKGVILSVSIDAYGAKNEEIRCGSSWLDIDRNMEIFCKLREINAITGLNVNTTVSIHNLTHVFRLIDYLNSLPSKCSLSLSILQHPHELQIRHAINTEKEEFITKCDAYISSFVPYSLENDVRPILLGIKNQL